MGAPEITQRFAGAEYAFVGACLLLGAMGGVLLRARNGRAAQVAQLGLALGCIAALATAVARLAGQGGAPLRLFSIVPELDVAVALSPLGAFLGISLALPLLLLGLHGLQHAGSDAAPVWRSASLLNLLALSAICLTVAATPATFLLCWHATGLLLASIVRLADDPQPERSHAQNGPADPGPIYAREPRLPTRVWSDAHMAAALLRRQSLALRLLLVWEGAALCLTVALLAGGNCQGIGATTQAPCSGPSSSSQQSLSFVMALAGGAGAAILTPLLCWLPGTRALPATAGIVLGGIAGSSGLFAVLQASYIVLPTGPTWWGLSTIAIGAAASILGGLFAGRQDTLAGLHAAAAVATTGLILVALGAGLLTRDALSGSDAALAPAATLFLLLTEPMALALLCLAAGATRPILPYLVGALALCGLPPLAPFVGVWLTLHALIAADTATSSQGIGEILLVAASVPMLTTVLLGTAYAAGFSRFVLGRNTGHRRALRTAVLALPALLLLILGLAPAAALWLIRPVTRSLTGTALPIDALFAGPLPGALALPAAGHSAGTTLFPAGLWVVLAGGGLSLWLILRVAARGNRSRLAPSWADGRPEGAAGGGLMLGMPARQDQSKLAAPLQWARLAGAAAFRRVLKGFHRYGHVTLQAPLLLVLAALVCALIVSR